MATKINQISLPKKLKAMRSWDMVVIKQGDITDALPLLNKLTFPISREYKQGNLIITRTA